MSVRGVDASGARSGPTTTDSAAFTKRTTHKPGPADGPNTTWSKAGKALRVADASARRASLGRKIDEALDQLETAELL
jgi:hypothetical protein